ncbi:hypothetical protein OSTOST_02190, partial [Ostertagia ostertagi]
MRGSGDRLPCRKVKVEPAATLNIKIQDTDVASVEFKGKQAEMNLHVLGGASRTFCGRDMIEALEINCGPHYPSIYRVQNRPRENVENRLAKVLEENTALFKPVLGECTTTHATLKFKVSEPIPKFFRARPVPLAFRPKVEEKIKELVSKGTLTRVDHSELVVVPKPGGKIRICGDYKITINPQLDIN